MPPATAWSSPWVPALGIDLAWRFDGLAALMLVLVVGIGLAVFVYAAGYLKGHPHLGRLYTLLTLFLLSMVGAVLADDLILLFVCWELTSVLSFLLVGFDHQKPASRSAALTALLITGLGGLFLLAGSIILVQVGGTSRISQLIPALAALPQSPTLTAGVVLLALGCFTKSATFPFHFWLPGAMAAPAPVSAYLHSATMVKLGVYVLARFDPAFGHWELWQAGLTGAGALTAAWAMVLALKEQDLKRILAWSTVSSLGTMVMLVGLPGPQAALGLVAFILAHALYKAPLFFVAGNVEKATGNRNAEELEGLLRGMPLTAAAALLAGIGMAGLPLSLGYVAKAVIKSAQSEAEVLAFVQRTTLLVSGVTVALAGVACIRIFWRRAATGNTPFREGNWLLTVPPLAIALLGIVLGSMPSLVKPMLLAAAAAVLPAGDTPPPSALDTGYAGGTISGTLVLGTLLYVFWGRIRRTFAALNERVRNYGVGVGFARLGQLGLQVAGTVTSATQGGRLSRYAAISIAALAAGLWALVALSGASLSVPNDALPPLPVLGALALTIAGALVTALTSQRALQLVTTGIVAYGSAIFLLFTGGPDVALTQFAVETVFVVVAAAMLLRAWRLGRIAGHAEPRFRPRAALLSLGFGAALAATLLIVTTQPFDPVLGAFFGERSLPEGYGRNVVNVILVDFRSLDTLGEGAVVAFAFMATLPMLLLLRRNRPRPPAND